MKFCIYRREIVCDSTATKIGRKRIIRLRPAFADALKIEVCMKTLI